jgi:hypothetical protein
MGTLTTFFVESAHHYGLAVLVVVPGTLLASCVLVARYLTKKAKL